MYSKSAHALVAGLVLSSMAPSPREMRLSDPDYRRVARRLNPPKPKPKSKAVQKRRAKNKAARKARRNG